MDFEFTAEEQFWRCPPSGTMKFPTPEAMQEAAIKAFDHFASHPHKETVLFHHKGTVVRTFKDVMRPFTFRGVALRMGTTAATLNNYRTVAGFKEVLEWMDEVIYTQKFEGAAGNMMNANFLARDLGLAERKELTGPNGGPLQTQDVTDEEALKDEARRLGIPLDAFGLGGEEEEGA